MFSDPFLNPIVISNVVLMLTLSITAIYTLILVIKALKIYIKNNS